ncbi:MAG TPA: DUF2917 domain-containing protein [Methylibium sp.]|uniref:DUF2917 domain-containing protein n=1 Tax=Methylibium sp. TaxID=2067992 RepID=UPI002DBE0981|nr:DUF2917 domain-containing protein [Methylibium sp.]HEU4458507.1 DUF2917 domain-containing protein [Methylibium sp.]
MSRADITRARLDPASHALLHADEAEGAVLECHDGRLWVTQHGDQRDIVLEAGQRFTIERPGRTLVEALRPAVVSLRRRRPARARPLPAPGRAARIGAGAVAACATFVLFEGIAELARWPVVTISLRLAGAALA